jgi:hypothetical protein
MNGTNFGFGTRFKTLLQMGAIEKKKKKGADNYWQNRCS